MRERQPLAPDPPVAREVPSGPAAVPNRTTTGVLGVIGLSAALVTCLAPRNLVSPGKWSSPLPTALPGAVHLIAGFERVVVRGRAFRGRAEAGAADGNAVRSSSSASGMAPAIDARSGTDSVQATSPQLRVPR